MNIAIVTCAGDALGGVFARAYRTAGGPDPARIYLLPSRSGLDFPGWARLPIGLRLLGIRGVFRLGSARHLRTLMRPSDRVAGLGEDFVAGMAGPTTVVETCAGTADFAERLARTRPDLLVSVGAPVVFGNAILATPRLGGINVHNGQLPKYRGHFGTFWEVVQGEATSETVIHRMAATVDAGPALVQAVVPMDAVAGFLDLLLEKKRLGGRMLAELLRTVAESGTLPPGTPMPAAMGPHWHFPTVREAFRFRWPQRRMPRT